MVVTQREILRVMVITKDHRIEGEMHILSGSRLTDSLNSRSKDFYPVTNAVIYRVNDDHIVASPPYVAVARDAVVAIFPIE